MIIYCDVSLQKIHEEGKNFAWERPLCRNCKSKVWGHGFVIRYFNSIKNGLLIKRWRCPNCGKIYICRPRDYWSRYQETITNIFNTLIYRVTHMKWPPWITRQRGGHWLGKFIKNARTNLLLKESVYEAILFYQKKNLTIN
jgi:ribosomal protein S27AE